MDDMDGCNIYEDEHYFNDAVPTIDGVPMTGAPTNGNVNLGVNENDPAASEDTDFAEYMWMLNEEEFDKEFLKGLEEEELIEQCMLQHMWENEHPPNGRTATEADGNHSNEGEQVDMARNSTLNPQAAEFIPSWMHANPVETIDDEEREICC